MIFLMRQWFLALAFGFGVLGYVWAQITEAPDALVLRVSQESIDAVKKDKDLTSGNVDRARDYTEANILPYIDFQHTTAIVVGQRWRQASPEQRERLQSAYKTLLLSTYAGALTKLSSNTVEVDPLRATGDDTEVVVRSRFVGGRRPIKLDYRMKKTGNGWKIYDVGIEGIWLSSSYRSQFASILRKQGLDGLIATLEKRAGVRKAS